MPRRKNSRFYNFGNNQIIDLTKVIGVQEVTLANGVVGAEVILEGGVFITVPQSCKTITDKVLALDKERDEK